MLKLPAPLGTEEVVRRVGLYPWLLPTLQGWHTKSDSPYIKAWAAAAQTIITAGVLGTRHPDDLCEVLKMPKTFILYALLIIRFSESEQDILWEIRDYLKTGCDGDYISDGVTQFAIRHFSRSLCGLTTLKALGLAF